ncbi:hypothetical protein BDW69DRAFT_156920 [Aspergillus filifer]
MGRSFVRGLHGRWQVIARGCWVASSIGLDLWVSTFRCGLRREESTSMRDLCVLYIHFVYSSWVMGTLVSLSYTILKNTSMSQ